MLPCCHRLLPAAPHARRLATAATQLPYHVPRNNRGSVPVYTDIRNAGTRHLTLIRNVQGNIDALAKDLADSLHSPGSPHAQRMKIQTIRSKHVVLSGGHWKHQLTRWLVSKGF